MHDSDQCRWAHVRYVDMKHKINAVCSIKGKQNLYEKLYLDHALMVNKSLLEDFMCRQHNGDRLH